MQVRTGQRVKAGEGLITFDLDFLARRVKSLLIPILVMNSGAFAVAWRAQDCATKVGARLMTLQSTDESGLIGPSGGADHRRALVLGLPHGLHARPAGRVAAMMKPFAAEASIFAKGRTANARSPVALMTLGAMRGDELELVCQGEDAQAALNTLAAFLVSDGGEVAAPPAPAHRSPSSTPSVQQIDGVLKGVPAAPGHAIGCAVQLRRKEIRVAEAGAGVPAEQANLKAAVDTVRKQTKSSGCHAAGTEIMTAHLALLDGVELHAAANLSFAEGKSAAYAWANALDEQAAALLSLDDLRLKERAGDLVDLKRQVLLVLRGQARSLKRFSGRRHSPGGRSTPLGTVGVT